MTQHISEVGQIDNTGDKQAFNFHVAGPSFISITSLVPKHCQERFLSLEPEIIPGY